ncbi:sulfurtransferase [Luteitalea sp. TBR-22]|uniref:sulfurtransferase n=1 Tax=Luteitalea sp. TBR-22 TaxID=2802971 RepID=UPI001AF9E4A1|nr:sulfurtransferase [Luteitalea sp. TBR-22]BCS35763.1 sulfurtransferase [Luteitalea sp. TBR-22]
MADNPKGYANPQLLITPGELSAQLAAGETPLLLDLRPAEAWAAGHLPGAVHLDLFGISLVDTDPAPLRAFLWILEHLLASRGVEAGRRVIVYDEKSGMRAARAFWALEFFGHPRTQQLDGGFGAWQAGGHPVSTEPVAPVATSWTGTPVEERIASYRHVWDRLKATDVAILDTRSDGEYDGTLVRAARGGRIPGAVHVEWTTNLRPDGSFKSSDELRAMYEPLGVTPDKEVLTYCQGGYRAAHGYLALRLLGYPRVRNYVGSWKEWGDRLELPVET